MFQNNIHVKELNLSNCSIDSDGACKLASSIGTDLIIIKLNYYMKILARKSQKFTINLIVI